MKLRNVTIWTTGLVLIVTVILPYLLICIDVIPFHGFDTIGTIILIWGYSSLPLIISLVIAKRLKHDIPALLLLGSTFVYGLWYAFAFYSFAVSSAGLACLMIFAVGILSLPVMIPAWITALLLNSYYVKKSSTDPGTTRRDTSLAAPSPAPFGDENVIE